MMGSRGLWPFRPMALLIRYASSRRACFDLSLISVVAVLGFFFFKIDTDIELD